MQAMRDAFFDRLYPFVKKDPSIMVLTSDFSAPSFDRYRAELPGQFINTGISEQNTILVASGLAMSGMRVFVVSIAPFITMRCFEQIRLYPADMNLNVTIVGVGAGFSYIEAGATHHSVEDIGLMRLLPHMRIFSASDNALVEHFVDCILESRGPFYVRLDRRSLPAVHPASPVFGQSLAPLSHSSGVNLLATGFMTHTALEISAALKNEGLEIGVVDAFRMPLNHDEFIETFTGTELLVSLEEHIAVGGLGAAARELIAEHNLQVKLCSFALDMSKGLCHSYGQRATLHARHGIDKTSIMRTIKGFMYDNANHNA